MTETVKKKSVSSKKHFKTFLAHLLNKMQSTGEILVTFSLLIVVISSAVVVVVFFFFHMIFFKF